MLEPHPLPHDLPEAKLPESSRAMLLRVKTQQVRMLRARGKRDHDFLRSLALLGVVGWSVTFPTLAGVALGIWADQMWPSRFSWTLMLLFTGLAIGCHNAWSHIRSG